MSEIIGDEPNTQPTPTVHYGPHGPYSDCAPGVEWAAPAMPDPRSADFTDHHNYPSAHSFTRDYILPGHASPDVGHLNYPDWTPQ